MQLVPEICQEYIGRTPDFVFHKVSSDILCGFNQDKRLTTPSAWAIPSTQA